MCDTVVATGSVTADGAVLFAKNSDREPDEPQALEVHPAAQHVAGSRLRCTYVEIPQTARTNRVPSSLRWINPSLAWLAELHGLA